MGIHSQAGYGFYVKLSMRTDALIISARAAIADLLGCDNDEVVFGANMTTLTFSVSRAIGRELQPGDESLYGITEPSQFTWRTPTVSIRIEGKAPATIATILGEKGIFAWYGNFYAVNLTEKLDVETSGGLLRIGLAHYNTYQIPDFFKKSGI